MTDKLEKTVKPKRYTSEELAQIKAIAKFTLEYGRKNIIGKYEFEHTAFGGKHATFTRNSFTENLRFGEGFDDKIDMLKNIDDLLKNIKYDRFDYNVRPKQKPDVDGYFVFKGEYKNNDVEYLFEKRKDGSILFHFIKLHKR